MKKLHNIWEISLTKNDSQQSKLTSIDTGETIKPAVSTVMVTILYKYFNT